MADKNDGSKGDPKKPKPLLDLKATEVRGSSASGDKPAPTSTLKGAPGWKEPSGDGKPASAASASGGSTGAGGSVSGQGSSQSPASSKPSGAASGSKTPSSSSTQSSSQRPKQSSVGSSSSSSSSSAVSATGAGAASAGAAKSGVANKPASGNAGSASASQKSGKQKSSPPPAPPAKSGGGFGSTLSHLVAGVVGGGIALFAAQPIEQGLGIALTSPAKIPVDVERRLVALEARPASAASDPALGEDVSKLRSQVTAAEKRLAELDALGKQVASLSSDVKKVQSSGGSASAGRSVSSATTTSNDGDGQTTQLRTRLAKLESAFSTLSSATTGSQGNTTGIAPLAQFSGKFADLETSLNTQLGSLRKSLMSELDTRVAATSDSTAKAVAGAERLDREVSEIKTDTARLEQRSTVLKTASDKLAASMRAISEQAAELKVELDALKGDVKQELTKVARPDDVQQAIAPVSKKVASIEKNLGSVLASESARKENAERIVLSLELSNLKRVLDRGAPYAAELDDVKKIAGDAIDFGSLDQYKSSGVPSGQELTRQFRDVAYQIINAEQAPKDGSRMDRLFAAAKSIVQVRRTDIPAQEKTAEAAVARIEKHLKDGDMSGALALAEKLPDKAKAPAKGWMSKLSARAGVDRAIAKIEGQLKASLGAPPVDKKS